MSPAVLSQLPSVLAQRFPAPLRSKRLKVHPGHVTQRPISVVRRDPLLRDGLGHYAGWQWHRQYVASTLSRFVAGKPIL